MVKAMGAIFHRKGILLDKMAVTKIKGHLPTDIKIQTQTGNSGTVSLNKVSFG